MTRLHFESKHGIGDILATIYCLENYGLQTGTKSLLTGNAVLQDILNLFFTNFISYSPDVSKTDLNKGLLLKNQDFYEHYICRIQRYLVDMGYNPKLSLPLKSIYSNVKNDYVLVQFDSRFSKRHNFDLKQNEMIKIIKLLARQEKIAVIGGQDTGKYLGDNFNYWLGDLKFLTKAVLSCKYFLGSDSGISHLAGVLGIKSKVVLLIPDTYNLIKKNMNNRPPCGLKDYYTNYENTSCYNRDILLKNLLL